MTSRKTLEASSIAGDNGSCHRPLEWVLKGMRTLRISGTTRESWSEGRQGHLDRDGIGPTPRCSRGFCLVLAILAGCAHTPVSPRLSLEDLSGQHVDPFAAKDAIANVFIFTRTDCPISNRYAPEVRRLQQKFSPERMEFYLVYVDPDERAETIRQHMKDYAYPCRALRDPQHALVKLTEATITPEAAVFVSHPAGPRMVYRGRIDNRYVDFGKARPAPTRHDLEEALAAVLAGESIPEPTTRAVGCFIGDLES